MALIKCHECGQPISRSAKSCPHCGADPNAPGKRRAVIVLLLVILVFVPIYHAYDNWATKKAEKKAHADEFFRRNSLTPQQRLAEDALQDNIRKAAEEKARITARIAAREAAEKPYLAACHAATLQSLYDPASAQISKNFGSFNPVGKWEGFLEGRAKNAFGALIFGAWKCTASQTNGQIQVLEIQQYQPHR